jgi:hypothetical protein
MGCIYAVDKSFDIGCNVIKWDDPNGFDFTAKHNYIRRDNISFDELSNDIKQFTIHWAASYRAKDVYTGLNARQLSVNFIIDDDEDENGYATVYQCLDLKHGAWSQGSGCNGIGAGVEIAYMPDAWDHPNRYSEANRGAHGVPDHEVTMGEVHGVKLKVFLPTEAQIKSLVQLIWGYTNLFPIPLTFPKKEDGSYILTTLPNPTEFSGLLNHYNINRQKVDTVGLDLADIESRLSAQTELGY